MGINGDVGGAGFEWRRLDQTDHGPLGRSFWSDVGPGFSIVTRELNQSVVSSSPDQTLLLRRFRNGENQIVKLDAGLILGDGAAGILLLRFVVAREVRADGFPGMAAIFRTEEELRRMIEDVRIVRRKNDGHRPGVAIFLHGSVVAIGIERPLLDVLELIRAAIETRNVAEVGAGIHDV